MYYLCKGTLIYRLKSHLVEERKMQFEPISEHIIQLLDERPLDAEEDEESIRLIISVISVKEIENDTDSDHDSLNIHSEPTQSPGNTGVFTVFCISTDRLSKFEFSFILTRSPVLKS